MNGDDLRGIHHCKFLFISFGHVIYLIFIYLHIATWRQRHNKIKNKNIKKIILTACFKASPMRSATSRFWWTSGGRLSHACTITNISSTPIPANIIIVPCFRKGILHHLYCVRLNCTDSNYSCKIPYYNTLYKFPMTILNLLTFLPFYSSTCIFSLVLVCIDRFISHTSDPVFDHISKHLKVC